MNTRRRYLIHGVFLWVEAEEGEGANARFAAALEEACREKWGEGTLVRNAGFPVQFNGYRWVKAS
jgi:hypothetical protein